MRPFTDSPVSNERGIALVTALLITLLLTLVVVALSHRVGLFALGTRDHVIKSQNLYTAEIGLNQARYFLLAKDCLPPNWDACIPRIHDNSVNKNVFTNISAGMKTIFGTQMPAFTVAGETFNFNLNGSMTHGAADTYNYKVYAKETNTPKVLNVLTVAERPGDSTQTVIDAGVIYTTQRADCYKQLGGCGDREGLSAESLGTAANSTNLRSKF